MNKLQCLSYVRVTFEILLSNLYLTKLLIKVIMISSSDWLELQFRNFMHSCIQMKHIQSQLLRHSSQLCPEGLFKFDTQVLPGRNLTSFNKLFIIFMKGRTSNFKRRLSAINFKLIRLNTQWFYYKAITKICLLTYEASN